MLPNHNLQKMKSNFFLFIHLLLVVALVPEADAQNILSNRLQNDKISGKDNPVVDFSVSLNLIPVGNSVMFNDLTTGSPLSWVWTFEGGEPNSYSGKIPPPVYYNLAGNYNVTLTVTFPDDLIITEEKQDFIQVMNYPEGWTYTATSNSHLISVPVTVTFPLSELTAGDFIGVFYTDQTGMEKCGGAVIWDTIHNKGLVAFGDDATTPDIKEGFDEGEDFLWKAWSASINEVSYALAGYDISLPNYDGKFASNGLSALQTFTFPVPPPVSVTAFASPETSCQGSSVQLNATVTGGSGDFLFAWTSIPPGFTSQEQNPLVYPVMSTTYLVTVTDGFTQDESEVSVAVTLLPLVNAGCDITLCENEFASLNATAQNHCGVFWQTSGDGVFNNPGTLFTNYTPGQGDLLAGFTELCLTALPCEPCTEPVMDFITIEYVDLPEADIIPENVTICETENFELTGLVSVENAASVEWVSSGDGIFIPDNSLPEPVYIPGPQDLSMGCVVLGISAAPFVPCSMPAEDSLLLCFSLVPFVDLGPDATVCENELILLTATVQNGCSYEWETMGDGYFDDPWIAGPQYIPGELDLQNGYFQLCLNVSACEPCFGTVSDCITIQIEQNPEVNILPEELIICGIDSLNLEGLVEAENYSAIQWESSGDGTFYPGADILSPVYLPGPVDITTGCIQLTVFAQPLMVCSTTASDAMQLCFQKLPVVALEGDATICEGDNLMLNPVVENYCDLIWETTGDGFFDNPASASAFYTPGVDDISDGSVELCLTLFPCEPCIEPAQECLTLTIGKKQTIIIPAGWSGISGYIDPFNNDIQTIMAPAIEKLITIYNPEGGTYSPLLMLYTLEFWDRLSGYVIKTSGETQITLCGNNPVSKTIQLDQGWNLIPVLSENDVPVAELFEPFMDQLIIIREVAGLGMYYPAYGIESLTQLQSGKSYLVKVASPITLNF